MEDGSIASETGKTLLTRRLALRGLLASSLFAAVAPWLGDAAEAKNKKKKKRRKRRRARRKKRSQGGSGAIPAHTEIDGEEQAFLTLINDYRAQHGKSALTLSPQLNAAAARHSMDMGLNNYFDHVNKQGKDVGNRASAEGYRWRVIGENIAAGTAQDTAAEAFAMWQSSPGHNQNMLDSDYRDIGIGREQVPGSRYGWYWTTVFGRSA
jgi:uncharacterized protein YkwD